MMMSRFARLRAFAYWSHVTVEGASVGRVIDTTFEQRLFLERPGLLEENRASDHIPPVTTWPSPGLPTEPGEAPLPTHRSTHGRPPQTYARLSHSTTLRADANPSTHWNARGEGRGDL